MRAAGNAFTLRLETPRLVMRPFDAADASVLSAYRSDPEIARYQGWTAPYSLDQAARFIEQTQQAVPGKLGEWCQLALERRDDGEVIGDCAFVVLATDPRQAEIGFTLARPYHGQGFASEAVRRLLDFLFGEMRLHRVRANCDPANAPSARVLTRVGMRYEGTFVQSLWFKDAWADEAWYAILEREWTSRSSGETR